MEIKSCDSLKTARVTEWTINHGGYLSISFGGLLIFGCIVAYVTAVLRGNVDPFLPLISDAAGSPPQNGIFGILLCIGGMLGVLFMALRYLIVVEQNAQGSNAVNYVNKISLVVGIASLCGITLITGYPANFYRDKDVWVNHVAIPHMIGGVVLFALGLIYIAMQCVLTLFLRSGHRLLVFLRICLCLATTAAFVHHAVTVPDNFGGIDFGNNTTLTTIDTNVSVTQIPLQSFKLYIAKGDTYLSSAISQWLLVILFSCFFFTFFSEAQEYSLQIIIETSDPDLDVNGEVAADSYGSRDGPSSYTRKTSHAYGNFPSGISYDAACRKPSGALNLRRDSSCQTKDEMFPKEISPTNGSSKSTHKANQPSERKLLDSKEQNGDSKNIKDLNAGTDDITVSGQELAPVANGTSASNGDIATADNKDIESNGNPEKL